MGRGSNNFFVPRPPAVREIRETSIEKKFLHIQQMIQQLRRI